MNKTIESSATSQRFLVLHTPSTVYSDSASRIPEIRTGLRQQIKLLRGIGVALPFLAIVGVIILWNILGSSCVDAYGFYAYIILGVFSVMSFLASLIPSLIISFCAGEIEEQMKKLNREV